MNNYSIPPTDPIDNQLTTYMLCYMFYSIYSETLPGHSCVLHFSLLVADPSHALSSGKHFLKDVWVPVPHETVQELHSLQLLHSENGVNRFVLRIIDQNDWEGWQIMYLLGQCWMLQLLDSSTSPLQECPPFTGDMHILDRFWTPKKHILNK